MSVSISKLLFGLPKIISEFRNRPHKPAGKGAAVDIGLKLKELRILKGLTQEELADRGGTVQRIHISAGEESDLSVHRHADGYSAVPWHEY